MSKTVAKSIRRGLEEAVAHARSEVNARKYRVHVPQRIDVCVSADDRSRVEDGARDVTRPSPSRRCM
ncbi:MAG: hypothetical protein ACRED7_07580 [Stellaceae bacterium]